VDGSPSVNNASFYFSGRVDSVLLINNIPEGVTYDNNLRFTFPPSAANSAITQLEVQGTNAAGSFVAIVPLSITFTVPNPIIPFDPPDAIVGQPYSYDGSSIWFGSKPTSYSIANPLPAGLTLDAATGWTTGIPTQVQVANNLALVGTNPAGTTSSSTASIAVTSVDNVKPVITLLGTTPVSVVANTSYADAGAEALDDVDGDITANIITVNPVDITTINPYNVTYNVSDAAGNAADEVIRVVNVIADTVKPVITLIGSEQR